MMELERESPNSLQERHEATFVNWFKSRVSAYEGVINIFFLVLPMPKFNNTFFLSNRFKNYVLRILQ